MVCEREGGREVVVSWAVLQAESMGGEVGRDAAVVINKIWVEYPQWEEARRV